MSDDRKDLQEVKSERIYAKPNPTFTLTWKNCQEQLPEEDGWYWCMVSEQGDLGKSHYQWNCYYSTTTKSWKTQGEGRQMKMVTVEWWTELAPYPF